MSKEAKGTPYGATGLEWGYGGQQFDRDRRVTVFPYEMLGDMLSLTPEASSLLLWIFCQYWPHNAPVSAESARLTYRMSRGRFSKVVDELKRAGVVVVSGDGLTPAKSFGPSAERSAPRQARPTREMPSDWLVKREAVFARDGYACVYCGSGGLELHCDHVEPVARGGGHEIENLVTACSICNLSKGSKTVAEWRPELAEAFRK